MEPSFDEMMANKSDEDLMEYIDNVPKYTVQAIQAAINELRKRGKQFTQEDLQEINQTIKEKATLKQKEEDTLKTNSWKKNIVTDPNAPQYYSQRAIWGFSIVFTVVFGAALLASNLKDKKAKWIVWTFGVVYTGIAIAIMNQLPRNTGLTIGINAGGAILLTQIFWNRFIGKDTTFRVKPIWKPLIISILIAIPFVLAAIYSGQ